MIDHTKEILQYLNLGLLIVDDQQRIVFCNEWFVDACNTTEERLINQKITDLFQRFQAPRLQSALNSAIDSGISSVLSYSLHKNIFPLLNDNGEEIDHSVSIRALSRAGDWHVLIQITDVSSANRRERSLRKAHQAVEEASRAKEEFLATISHELRTPLTSIIGNSELLIEQDNNPEQQEIMQAILNAGRNQLALVNDMLDMTKIESGKFTVEAIPYNFSHLLSNIEQMFSTMASDAGLTFSVIQHNHEANLLIGDGQRIGQILINLLGNACKFSEKGGITLTTAVHDGQLTCQVTDTGIGMSEAVLENLFQKFKQADSSISRRFGGSGLGLFISFNLAQMMGGSIAVKSRVGEGSSFTLKLPYQQSTTAITLSADSGTLRSQPDHKIEGHVLIAEDTPELQLLERRILESLGCTVTLASDGKKAVELATNHHFDLILMDMQMPIMDGIEATQLLKQRGCATPVVALTANVMKKHRDAFDKAGVDGFLSKPIDKTELVLILKRYMEKAAAPTETDYSDYIDDELMAIFFNTLTKHRNTLISALEKGDWSSARSTAHTIKGSAASFGQPQLSKIAATAHTAFDEDRTDQALELTQTLITEIEQIIR